MVITHDGKMLIAALQGANSDGYVMFFDINRLTTSEENPRLGYITEGAGTASIYVNVTADDKTLFVSDEFAAKISVIDLDALRVHGFNYPSKLGEIPVGGSPIALTFSPDEHWLYTTSEVAPPAWGWPRILPREDGKPGKASEGAVIVVDVTKAKSDPRNSVVARVPAGGSPVRLALSPAGDRLFVAARHSNAVLVFDTTKLISEPQRAKLATIPVGTSPVPVVLVDNGRTAIVGNSNRYSANANAPSTLTAFYTNRVNEGRGTLIRNIPAGAYPREFCLSPDGQTLFLNNFLSRSLQVMNVSAILH
jgi:DNA-binding beta-propeller fold protein YncE